MVLQLLLQQTAVSPSDDDLSSLATAVSAFSHLHEWCAAHLTDFYHTSFPFVFVAVLMLVSFPFLLLVDGDTRRKPLRRGMAALLVLFPLALLMEAGFLLTMGFSEDVIWWCTPVRYGFLGALWRICLLVTVLLVQFVDMVNFSGEMAAMLCSQSGKKGADVSFNLWPAFVGMALCLPAFYVSLFAIAYLHLPLWVSMCVLWGVLAWGLLKMAALNVKTFGPLKGLVASMLAIVLNFGYLVTILIFIMAVYRLFIYVVLACPWLVFLWYAGTKYFPTISFPNRNITFRDSHGGWHVSQTDRDAANESFK